MAPGVADRKGLAFSVEERPELAAAHSFEDVLCVLGLVVEVGVGVKGDAGAGVAEDAADMGDVEVEVDDEVAGVGLVVRAVDVYGWQVLHLLFGDVELDTLVDLSDGADWDSYFFAAP